MSDMQARTALDAIKTAILAEMQGLELYRSAAERTKDPEAKKMFEMLAREESEHNAMLRQQFQSLVNDSKWLPPPQVDPDDGFAGLVADEAWRKSLEFGNMELSVVSIGVGLETRAIAFYQKAADMTEDPEGKKVFEWLVSWERGHLKWLQWLEDDLKTKFWSDQNFAPF